jgi:hypothetical protein
MQGTDAGWVRMTATSEIGYRRSDCIVFGIDPNRDDWALAMAGVDRAAIYGEDEGAGWRWTGQRDMVAPVAALLDAARQLPSGQYVDLSFELVKE